MQYYSASTTDAWQKSSMNIVCEIFYTHFPVILRVFDNTVSRTVNYMHFRFVFRFYLRQLLVYFRPLYMFLLRVAVDTAIIMSVSGAL